MQPHDLVFDGRYAREATTMYTTEADKQRDAALEHLDAAVQALSEIVVGKCEGHDEFTTEYRETLRRTFLQLLKVRDNFTRR